ncbi:hypothetical protein FQ192_09010 [Pseudomonas sp. ANT_J12]|nr:hypothetical protein FQ192_09010 [Pseudomonas sp. ANT_J12]
MWLDDDLWRGSLLPLGREAAPCISSRYTAFAGLTTAAQPSGNKLPRHKSPASLRLGLLLPSTAATTTAPRRIWPPLPGARCAAPGHLHWRG